MVKIIGNVLAIRWTAGAVEHLRPSFSALLDAEERLASVIRRWAGQPHQLKPSNHTVLDTVGALEPIAQPPPPPPPHLWSLWPRARGLRGTAASRPC